MWGSLLDGLVVQVALDDPVVDAQRWPARSRSSVAYKELGLSAGAPAASSKKS